MYSLITNSKKGNLLTELIQSIETCERFYFNVAFVNFSGLQLLLDSFQKAAGKGTEGKVLTGTYLNFTEPYALKRLQRFTHIETRVFVAGDKIGFHPKAYIFEYADYYKVIVGSSNITQHALKSNIEWNLEIITKNDSDDREFMEDVMAAYQEIWQAAEELDDVFLQEYEGFLKDRRQIHVVNEDKLVFQFTRGPSISPNAMQEEAMDRLKLLREKHQDRALVIAATGTGKTYLSAFDVKQVRPARLLFLVHREEILQKAKVSFEKVMDLRAKKVGILAGNSKATDSDYLFATIQSMQRCYQDFRPDYFDYIVVDEAHHAASPTYQNVLGHFKPAFLLGMTATPERTDDGNIFDLFDNNVPVEVRLREALEQDLLVPFHYFGIADTSGVDLSDADKLTPAQLAKRLSVHRRVDFIVEKMGFYGHDGPKRKGLGFCATVEHAQFMAHEFNERGIKSICLSGKDDVKKRQSYIRLLEADDSDLEMIFTVDIFNEGIDIPGVNLVLMLRPTESAIVFTQQLGRGLRKKEEKQFLTVLDFIGNYSKSFLIAIALNGSRYKDKKSISNEVRQGFRSIPEPSHIRLDEVTREQILKQLERENFYSLEYLKEDYLQFKNARGGKVPWLLQDYLTIEQAPDPVRFFSRSISSTGSRNYLQFLNRMEKENTVLEHLTNNDAFMYVLTELAQLLPLKRPHDFAVLEYLMEEESITLAEAVTWAEQYVDGADPDTVSHALETWCMDYADKAEAATKKPLLERAGEDQYRRTACLSAVLADQEQKRYLLDVLHYGFIRYQDEFAMENQGVPFLKLYQEYSQREVGLMANYRNTHSAFRGSTLQEKPDGDHYFLFIDLHKDEGIEESINYKDKFISRSQFQWESPNNTTLLSERGIDLTQGSRRGKTIHLFVRKFKKVNNVTQKYTYIGVGEPLSHRKEKPIEIQYALKNKIPLDLYEEFEPEIQTVKAEL